MTTRKITLSAAALLMAAAFAGCSGNTTSASSNSSSAAEAGSSAADTSAADSSAADSTASDSTASKLDTDITVVSREDGSGTRGAFVELMGIEQKNEAGEKIDHTVETAEITDSTSVMMQTIAGNSAAIGYISLGSLNDTVKAVQVDGVAPTTDSVKDGSYAIARPFNIAVKGEPTPLAQDLIDFILSAEGQAIVAEDYVTIADDAPAFAGALPEGSITISGSSSVYPLMEKLVEAYQVLNPNANISLQSSDSTSGMNDAMSGVAQIGMASRALKDSESAELTGIQIAMDGIAVIVHPDNEVENLTLEQLKSIFTGEITQWSQLA